MSGALGMIGNLFAGLAALTLAAIGMSYWMRPAQALKETGHLAKALPAVMGGRYIALALFGFGALLHGDPTITAFVFFVLGLLGMTDAVIYAQRGAPILRHALAGGGSFVIAGLAFLGGSSFGA